MAEFVDTAKHKEVGSNWDDVVIENLIEDIPGGVTLDVSDLSDDSDFVYAGHVVVKDGDNYKALATDSDGEYEETESGDEGGYEDDGAFIGVVYRTIEKSKPLAQVVTRGTVNRKAAVEAGAPDYEGIDLKSEMPLIRFVKY